MHSICNARRYLLEQMPSEKRRAKQPTLDKTKRFLIFEDETTSTNETKRLEQKWVRKWNIQAT